MYLQANIFTAAFSSMLLQPSGAATSLLSRLHSSSKMANLQRKPQSRRTEDFECEPIPEILIEEPVYLDLFSPEHQPVCDCGGRPSGIDLVGFFADNPMPASQDELQGWADSFNNDFVRDVRYTDQYGCKNQCSFCLEGSDSCVLLDVNRGGEVATFGFEGFTIEELSAIAAAPLENAAMVDRRIGVSMAGQFFSACHTFTAGETGTVCFTAGETLPDSDFAIFPGFEPFCTVSVDGVDCMSCEEIGDDFHIVADCTNIARAPAMINTAVEDPTGIYAPLKITAVAGAFEEETIPHTFGSCPTEQGTDPMTPPSPPVVVETPGGGPSEPVVDTTIPTPPGETVEVPPVEPVVDATPPGETVDVPPVEPVVDATPPSPPDDMEEPPVKPATADTTSQSAGSFLTCMSAGLAVIAAFVI